ncbi:unnamed protein product, partial [Didymodactylos carnosus]
LNSMSVVSQVTEPDAVNDYGSDVLNQPFPIRVMALKVEGSTHPTSQSTQVQHQIELQIGEREKIGQGTFGKVFRAKLLNTEEIIAIKEVEMEEKFKSRELDMLKMLNHPNI